MSFKTTPYHRGEVSMTSQLQQHNEACLAPEGHVTNRFLRPRDNFRCDWLGCGGAFTRRSDLTRHRITVHQFTKPFWCHVPYCNRSEAYPGRERKPFSRKDKRDEHVRNVHDGDNPPGKNRKTTGPMTQPRPQRTRQPESDIDGAQFGQVDQSYPVGMMTDASEHAGPSTHSIQTPFCYAAGNGSTSYTVEPGFTGHAGTLATTGSANFDDSHVSPTAPDRDWVPRNPDFTWGTQPEMLASIDKSSEVNGLLEVNGAADISRLALADATNITVEADQFNPAHVTNDLDSSCPPDAGSDLENEAFNFYPQFLPTSRNT